jgi:uncharacterized cupin superfamily protein
VFKADGEETDNRHSVSGWWLEPRTAGPGAHRHEHNEETFYVLEGRVPDRRALARRPRGTFLRIAGGVTHDFENRTDQRVGLLAGHR